MWLGWMDKAKQCIYCECFFSPILCYGLWRRRGVGESTTLACTTNLFFSPARPTWVPLFDSRSGRCSRPPRPSLSLLSPLSLSEPPSETETSPRLHPRPCKGGPTDATECVCVCARVKRRCWQCWLWRCQVSYNCICAVALRETGYS